MKMMERLLRNVGRSWDRIPKEVPVLFISRGTGAHSLMTVDNNALHFHTLPYRHNLPTKQTVALEALGLEELISIVRGMGYTAELTSEVENKKLKHRKTFTLLDASNLTLNEGSHLVTFTSKLWETLYPLARLLQEVDNDIEKAIEEMFATTTRGRWLEYWASFFGLRRLTDESDESLRKRMFVTMTNVKTNNIAIEELVRYVVQDTIVVEDKSPALMEITTDPKYIEFGSRLHEVVMSIKGAGIAYVLNFAKTWSEDYPSYYRDSNGASMTNADVLVTMVNITSMYENYTFPTEDNDISTLTGTMYNDDLYLKLTNQYNFADTLTLGSGTLGVEDLIALGDIEGAFALPVMILKDADGNVIRDTTI